MKFVFNKMFSSLKMLKGTIVVFGLTLSLFAHAQEVPSAGEKNAVDIEVKGILEKHPNLIVPEGYLANGFKADHGKDITSELSDGAKKSYDSCMSDTDDHSICFSRARELSQKEAEFEKRKEKVHKACLAELDDLEACGRRVKEMRIDDKPIERSPEKPLEQPAIKSSVDETKKIELKYDNSNADQKEEKVAGKDEGSKEENRPKEDSAEAAAKRFAETGF